MDFVSAGIRIRKNVNEIYPKFRILPSKDLMVRGRDFYAAYDEETGLWSKEEFEVIDRIDDLLSQKAKSLDGGPSIVLYLSDAETNMIDNWHKYCQKQMRDNYHQLDSKLIFSNQETKREDYATKKLPYPLEQGPHEAYDELMDVLYSPEERHKLEWAIGAVITGDSKNIQKFIVLYGAAGTGKSTVLNIIEKLFEGYTAVFDSKALGNANNAYALESFKSNPLVAIQHDGDLSRIEDNTKLNSLVSHETMSINEKYKSLYEMRFDTFLFMGTNKPVKITDARSGLLRRLIDVRPTGNKVHPQTYKRLMKQIMFELGAIAYHCREVYLENPGIYDYYVPLDMMEKTNDMFFFIKDNYLLFKNSNEIKLNAAWRLYKEYCEDARVPYPLTKRAFKDEFQNYWKTFDEDIFKDFLSNKIDNVNLKEDVKNDINWLQLNETNSLLDELYSDCKAQYSNQDGVPCDKWDNIITKLKDIETSQEHYVMPPNSSHIVVDFDIKDANGNKCKKKNIEAASKWPKTYAELSKSGEGIHLHYIYDGDVNKLCRIYDSDIEIKVFSGKSSLRRKLTKCNNLPIAHINSGLPLREERAKMIDKEVVQNEKTIRTAIKRAIMKDIWPNTRPNVDFIKKVLDDAYEAGIKYDVTDLKQDVTIFASQSSHQARQCLNIVAQMQFVGKQEFEGLKQKDELPILFYDVEVFQNLFVIVSKELGIDKPYLKYINPSPEEVEKLVSNYRLIGFNCREYDNHILYGRMLGFNNLDLYYLSQDIINDNGKRKFRDAYNLSFTDIYDYAREKQSLKKWEIALGIHHQELGLEWDKPVPQELFSTVCDYCCNDVMATEAVFNATQADFTARLILSEIADMTPNDTTNQLTTKIIFGSEKHPKLVYTHLEETFPGYEYRRMTDEEAVLNGLKQADIGMHNMYRGVDLGYGGYVYAKPGMYTNVALLDVASLHPHSALAMKYFGEYDQKFRDLVNARIFIKHKEFDKLNSIFEGKFAKYATDPSQAKALSGALKLAINSVYGLTSARFPNPFKIEENVNNIIALRGALFMKTLQDEVTERGYTVVHIKTDSIKIANADQEIIDYCMKRARDYEYEFEHEATYEKICLVNNAVYIAKDASDGHWTATGTQFQVPYVFKTLFSKEPLTFDDLCVTKSVQTSIYLDFNEGLNDGEHDYRFVGKVGHFVPVNDGYGGAIIYRRGVDNKGNYKYDSVTGTKRKNGKHYRFFESEDIRNKENWNDYICYEYWNELATDALIEIGKYCDVESFRI